MEVWDGIDILLIPWLAVLFEGTSTPALKTRLPVRHPHLCIPSEIQNCMAAQGSIQAQHSTRIRTGKVKRLGLSKEQREGKNIYVGIE